MIVVSDTTPLSELSKIGKLDLLQAVFGRVISSRAKLITHLFNLE